MFKPELPKVKVKAVPVEVYSRVVGYFRPVQNWNKGKQQEFSERKHIPVRNLDPLRGCSCK